MFEVNSFIFVLNEPPQLSIGPHRFFMVSGKIPKALQHSRRHLSKIAKIDKNKNENEKTLKTSLILSWEFP